MEKTRRVADAGMREGRTRGYRFRPRVAITKRIMGRLLSRGARCINDLSASATFGMISWAHFC